MSAEQTSEIEMGIETGKKCQRKQASEITEIT